MDIDQCAVKETGRKQAVDPVEHAAVAGKDVAAVFYARTALQPGFKKIACLGDKGDGGASKRREQWGEGGEVAAEQCGNGSACSHATE